MIGTGKRNSLTSSGYIYLSVAGLCLGSITSEAQNRQAKKPNVLVISPNGSKDNWPVQRGFDRFFGILNGSGSYFDPGTLISNNTFVAPGKNFYYTNAISDSTVKFIQENPKDKPFFFYVAYTAAHWPLHAPESEIAKYKGKYDIGWDSLRVVRFNKLKKLGIISSNCVLSKRSVEIPEWKNEPLKEWQARRMEVYAAMIDVKDQGIGRIITALEKKGELENEATEKV